MMNIECSDEYTPYSQCYVIVAPVLLDPPTRYPHHPPIMLGDKRHYVGGVDFIVDIRSLRLLIDNEVMR